MNKQIDWLFLKRPIIIFLMLLVLALLAYFAGLKFQESVKTDFDQAQADLSRSYSNLRNQSQQIAIIDDYLNQYKELENQGVIGNERRLSWIESIKKSNDEIKLPTFSYAIQPQEVFERPQLKSSKKVKLLSSKMTMRLGLLHEVDLFKTLDLMKQNVSSHFTVEHCQLIGNSKQKDLQIDVANINANCDIRWVNIQVAEK